MSRFYELHAAGNPLLRCIADAGWAYVEPAEALFWRGGPDGVFFRDILARQLRKLNPAIIQSDMVQEIITRFDRLHPTIEGNRSVLAWLKGEQACDDNPSRKLRLIDFNNPANNVYHVTNNWQYSQFFSEKFDLVLLINGIPLAVAERRAPIDTDSRVQIVERFISVENRLPDFFKILQLVLLNAPDRLWIGLPFDLKPQNLTSWKPATGQDQEQWLRRIFGHKQFLGILKHNILFIKNDDFAAKLVLRQYQVEAVEQALHRIERRQHGLFYLAQGTGKTVTIIATAAQLLSDSKTGARLSVLIFADPNEIDTGVMQSLEGCYPVRIANSGKELQAVLASDYRGMLISPLEFALELQPGTNGRENVVVLIDEAHRIFEDNIVGKIDAALPNAIMIGYTGSPSRETGLAEDSGHPVSLYSSEQALADIIVTPVCYCLAPPAIQINSDTLSKEFVRNKSFQGSCDIMTLNGALERADCLAAAVKDRERIEKAAAYIARHFKEKVEPLRQKAILVAYDKETCGLYRKALDRYLPAGFSQVIYAANKKDSLTLKEYYRTSHDEKRLRKAFAQSQEPPHILILTDKLLAGFHFPALTVLYLDKPLQDHILVQVLSRVNRPYCDKAGYKQAGVVVDLLGLFNHSTELAIGVFPDGVPGLQPMDTVQNRFSSLLKEIMLKYTVVLAGFGEQSREWAVEYFLDYTIRQEFFGFFRHLQSLYDLLYPSSFISQYQDEYKIFAKLYGLVYNAYNVTPRLEFTAKTAGLFDEASFHWMRELPGIITRLTEQELIKWKNGPDSETIKALQFWKLLEQISAQPDSVHYELTILNEKADWLIHAMQAGRKTSHEVFISLLEMVEKYLHIEQLRQESGVGENIYAIYRTLETFIPDVTMDQAAYLDSILRQHPDFLWNKKHFMRVHTDLCLALLPIVGPGRFVQAANTLIHLPRP